MKKTFLKKSIWRQYHTLGLPKAASLKKGCLKHSKSWGLRTSERFTSTGEAWDVGFVIKHNTFLIKLRRKKKSEKVKLNKTYVFYQSRCQKWANCMRLLKKKKKPQNHNNKGQVLSGHGFTEAKWVVASKSEHSYTKERQVAVQGDQQ